jgi:hypothetical protein
MRVQAAAILIHESLHHFLGRDEERVKKITSFVMETWQALNGTPDAERNTDLIP